MIEDTDLSILHFKYELKHIVTGRSSIAQLGEHWTPNLWTAVQSPVKEQVIIVTVKWIGIRVRLIKNN